MYNMGWSEPHYQNAHKERADCIAILERIKDVKAGKPVEIVPETSKRDDEKQLRMF